MAYSWTASDDLYTLSHDLAGSAYDVNFVDSYSPAHQILQSSISNPTAYEYGTPTAATTNYTPNGLNQYATITPSGGSATTLRYDPNGNLTYDGIYNYTYDSENRLTAASMTGMSASYLYAPAGRRREKIVTGGTYAGTTQLLSAGDDEIAEYDGSGTLLRRYIPGRAVDQPIAMVTAAGIKTFFHQDRVMGSER